MKPLMPDERHNDRRNAAQPRMPRSGEVLRITRAASPQFAVNPILFRVTRKLDRETYDGWVWLDGYELNQVGEAIEQRSIFVQVAGLQWARLPQDSPVRYRANADRAAGNASQRAGNSPSASRTTPTRRTPR